MPADGLVERGTPSASHKSIFPRKIEVHNVQWLIVFCLWNSATSGGGTRDPPLVTTRPLFRYGSPSYVLALMQLSLPFARLFTFAS